MVNSINYTIETAHDWSYTWYKSSSLLKKRIRDASTKSQLESKLWVINELIKLNVNPTRIALLGGWFANYITPLLVDNLDVKFIKNYDIDPDILNLSKSLNKRYNLIYRTLRSNVMLESIESIFDTVINTSCEHMFPMIQFRKLNPKLKPVYVLQSTNETKYDDHINCVNSPEELANQAMLQEVYYSGTKILDNGMTRFMVIGK